MLQTFMAALQDNVLARSKLDDEPLHTGLGRCQAWVRNDNELLPCSAAPLAHPAFLLLEVEAGQVKTPVWLQNEG